MAEKAVPTVSAKALIRKIYRDLKPNYDSWTDDVFEWVGEAIAHIGTCGGFKTVRNHPVEVEDFKFAVPCDFVEHRKLEYKGVRVNKMISQSFDSEDLNFRDQPLYPGLGYIPDPGYYHVIHESAPLGDYKLTYKAYNTDEEGLPLIPDTPEYKEALFFYVLTKMILGGYEHPIFSYDKAEIWWDHWCTKARNDIRFPSVDDADRMLQWWTDMSRRTASWRDDFADFNFPSEHVV